MKGSKDHFPACIPEIEKIIGYDFFDKSLLTQAFTRTSYCNEQNQRGKSIQSNEVLEFVGDSVLSVSIITFLMRENAERYEHGIRTRLDEGDFSNVKSKLSDKTNLSKCIMALGLEKYLRLGEGDKKLGIEREPSVMEDLFESIIGAVYFDSDMNVAVVMGVVSRMLDLSAYAVKTPPIQSSKNALQEFCADKKRRLPPPVYKTLGEEGPDHKKVYERGVYIGERLVARAKGKNQKHADAAAAEAALAILEDEEKAKAKVPEKKATEAKPTEKKTAKKKPADKTTPVKEAPKEKGPTAEKKSSKKAKKPAPTAEKPGVNEEKAAPKVEKPTEKKPEKKGKEKKADPAQAPETKTTKKQTKVDKKKEKETAVSEPHAVVKKPINLTRPTTNAAKSNIYESSASAKLKTHAMRSGVVLASHRNAFRLLFQYKAFAYLDLVCINP